MRMTIRTPTKNGFYWIDRENSKGRVYRTIVKVYGRGGPDHLFADGENFPLHGYGVLRWSDSPIPEPEADPL